MGDVTLASWYSIVFALIYDICLFVVVMIVGVVSILPVIWKDRPECLEPHAIKDFDGLDIVNKQHPSRKMDEFTATKSHSHSRAYFLISAIFLVLVLLGVYKQKRKDESFKKYMMEVFSTLPERDESNQQRDFPYIIDTRNPPPDWIIVDKEESKRSLNYYWIK